VRFLGCDMRRCLLAGAKLGDNRFDGSCLIAAAGLTEIRARTIRDQGGEFLRVLRGGKRK
jgi:hypothetical protein